MGAYIFSTAPDQWLIHCATRVLGVHRDNIRNKTLSAAETLQFMEVEARFLVGVLNFKHKIHQLTQKLERWCALGRKPFLRELDEDGAHSPM